MQNGTRSSLALRGGLTGLVLCILSVSVAAEDENAAVDPAPADQDVVALIAELRGILLQREARVTSFRAEYTLRQMNIDPESGNWEGEKARLLFRDPDVRLDTWPPSGSHIIKGRLNGVRTELRFGKDDAPAGARVELDQSPLPLPYQGSHVVIDPRLALFGLIHGETLKSRFAAAPLAAAVMDDGRRRLTWYAPPGSRPNRIDFLLDAKDRLVQIDYGICATVTANPAVADLIKEFGEDKFFRVEWSLTMSDFKETDGIPVPLVTRRTYWEGDGSSGAAALKRFEETGRIKKSQVQTGSPLEKLQNSVRSSQTALLPDGLTPTERRRRIDVITMFQTKPPRATNVLEMHIDLDSVEINPPINDEDLLIDIPDGTNVFGDASLVAGPAQDTPPADSAGPSAP